MKYPKIRMRAMTPTECHELRIKVLDELENGSKSTRYLSEKFDITKSSMSKHMRKLANEGWIHSLRYAGTSGNVSFDWALGGGPHEVIARQEEAQDDSGKAKQLRRGTWPAVTIPKQSPWSALGL